VVGLTCQTLGRRRGVACFKFGTTPLTQWALLLEKKIFFFQGLEDLFKALGIMSIGKWFKEAKGYNWSPSFMNVECQVALFT
jgi:hypothetical protein